MHEAADWLHPGRRENGDRTARVNLLLWTFDEMRRLGKIANFLPHD